MKKINVFFVLIFLAWGMPFSYGGEHGGTTQEHGGAAAAKAPSADDIRQAMKDYVTQESEETGTFDVFDPETGDMRELSLVRVHERVGKTGNYYYSCADFKDINSGEMLDLDLDVEDQDGNLSVVDVRIHKVNGKERYTYDANDNRIPIASSASEPKTTATQEHGGGTPAAPKEHGGAGSMETKEHGGN